MAEQTVLCPNCGKRFPLTKALGGQLEKTIRSQLTSEFKQKEKELKTQYAQLVAGAKKEAEKEVNRKAKAELADLRRELTESEEELDTARRKELKLLKRQRDLDEKQKNLELELQRRLNEERKRLEEQISTRLAEANRLKDLEKDKQLSDMRSQIDDLKRKAELGSQEARGEAVELHIEDILRAAFPQDEIEPVAKGIRGADLIQRVRNVVGQLSGSIMWEFKSARSWSDAWPTKLKDDQRAAKADIAVLATYAMPRGLLHFGLVEGVWVTDVDTLVGAASALRSSLIELYATRASEVGKAEKMELLYGYLAGPEFSQRVEGIVDAFLAMREDLDRERRSMEASWSRREKQIEKVVKNVGGMYGDVQGIVGAALPKIDQLELPRPSQLLEEPPTGPEAA